MVPVPAAAVPVPTTAPVPQATAPAAHQPAPSQRHRGAEPFPVAAPSEPMEARGHGGRELHFSTARGKAPYVEDDVLEQSLESSMDLRM